MAGVRPPKPYGVVAEFATPEEILAAAKAMKAKGYKDMESYSPIPIHGMTEIFEFEDSRLGWMVFFAGVAGAATGLGLQYYTSVIDYMWNAGGMPAFSLPAFIPITFECTILFAGITATFGMFALNGLPKPHHPFFNAQRARRASQDRYLLCVEATNTDYDEERIIGEFLELDALSVEPVWTSGGYL